MPAQLSVPAAQVPASRAASSGAGSFDPSAPTVARSGLFERARAHSADDQARDAVRLHRPRDLNAALVAGASLNTRYADTGCTLLQEAIRLGRTQMAVQLLEASYRRGGEQRFADVNIPGPGGRTALHMAIAQGDLRVLQAMQKRAISQPTAGGKHGTGLDLDARDDAQLTPRQMVSASRDLALQHLFERFERRSPATREAASASAPTLASSRRPGHGPLGDVQRRPVLRPEAQVDTIAEAEFLSWKRLPAA